MLSTTRSLYVSLFYAALVLPVLSVDASAPDRLTKNEYTVLKTCEGIIRLFRQSSDEIWPGFNLAEKPFIVYIPGKWVLLLNYAHPVDGFSEYPRDWPDLGCSALYHQGQYKDLIGQLAFDFQVDTFRTVAIGIPEENLDSLANPEFWVFGLCVHEAFHQFQSESFGEIPWEREEQYPILDSQNTSLAYIEMKLLEDALIMMQVSNGEKCREYIEQFIAIRNYRWQNADPFVARYEQGQEIREGTAKYVEMKSMEAMRRVTYKSALEGLTSPLLQDFDSITFPGCLIRDLEDRMTGNSVRPEDMLRNRIYPVGSTIGFLLDWLNSDWKSKAQQAGQQFTFQEILTDALGLQGNLPGELVDRTKDAYSFNVVLTSTNKIIAEYLEGFKKECTVFESQNGYRIQIDFIARSLSRSRVSREKKWLVDKGTQSLCSNYQVYTLKNNDLLLQIRNSAVRENNDWDSRKYSAIFFAPELPDIMMDGQNFTFVNNQPQPFQSLELSSANFKFTSSKPGTITLSGKQMTVRLNQ
jgi:hypothetical protein